MKRIFRRSQIRPDSRRDVGDEIDFHLDMRTREFIEQGMSPDDARRAAANAFGDLPAIGAELRTAREAHTRSRDRADRWSDFVSDIAFAARTLRHNLGFTAAALATLALGIGATTSVFTVVNGVLLRPLPYADPSRLAMVWMAEAKENYDIPLSSGFYNDVSRTAEPLAATAAFRSWGYALTTPSETEQVEGARISPALFSVLGVHPTLGRDFTAEDGEPGAPSVVMLSDGLWRSRFGGDRAIVGKQIQLGGQPFKVVGVMPAGFGFPRGAELPAGLQFPPRTLLWTPLQFTASDKTSYRANNLSAIARLKPGVTGERLRLTLNRQIKEFLAANAPKLRLDYKITTLQDQASQNVRRTLLLLLAAVALLLIIACANVTNLLIARTAARRREFAVRAALGAGRTRIARQLVTENVMLTLCGTVLGVAVSAWASRAMVAMAPGSLPRADDISIDWRVALAAGAATLIVGLIFGLAATSQVGWNALAGTLREEGGRTTVGRAQSMRRSALVVAEVSLSLVLLIAASLLTVSFLRIQRVEPGFDPSNTLTAGVAIPIPGGFNPKADGPRWAQFFRQFQERVSKIPGVEAAGAISGLPLTGAAEGGGTAVIGDPEPAPGTALRGQYFVIDGDYFRAAGITLLAGRAFGPQDIATSTPVIIVNREYARKYLHDKPLDKQLRAYFDFTDPGPRTIVGVVDNVQSASLDGEPTPQVYVPQQQMSYPRLEVVLRTSADPMTLVPALKQATREIDPGIAVSHPRTMRQVFDESLARRRFSMTLIGIFAGSAVALAMIGLYGVIALSIGHRRREIGVRMALGARPVDVLRLVLGEGMRITIVGVVIGLAGAYAASKLVSSMLYGTSPTSVGVYATASATILLVTLAATYIPARRATRVDPTAALRSS
jgi:predicted permease